MSGGGSDGEGRASEGGRVEGWSAMAAIYGDDAIRRDEGGGEGDEGGGEMRAGRATRALGNVLGSPTLPTWTPLTERS